MQTYVLALLDHGHHGEVGILLEIYCEHETCWYTFCAVHMSCKQKRMRHWSAGILLCFAVRN
jgi:hypothetical protein